GYRISASRGRTGSLDREGRRGGWFDGGRAPRPCSAGNVLHSIGAHGHGSREIPDRDRIQSERGAASTSDRRVVRELIHDEPVIRRIWRHFAGARIPRTGPSRMCVLSRGRLPAGKVRLRPECRHWNCEYFGRSTVPPGVVVRDQRALERRPVRTPERTIQEKLLPCSARDNAVGKRRRRGDQIVALPGFPVADLNTSRLSDHQQLTLIVQKGVSAKDRIRGIT